jgi:serine/threonine protein kinase
MKSAPIQVGQYTLDARDTQTQNSCIEYTGTKGSRRFNVFRFLRSTINNTSYIKEMEGQIEILGSLEHQNIQELINIVIVNEDLYAFYDYEWFTLANLIEKNVKIPENLARQIFYQVLTALSYMHEQKVAHLNICPSSVYFNRQQIAMVGRLFNAERFDDGALCSKATGMVNFQPPEVFSGDPFDPFKVDVWGMGLLLFMLLTNSTPYYGDTEEEVKRRILTGELGIESYISKGAKDVLSAALNSNPAERATIDQLLSMEWVKSQRLRDDVDIQSIESIFTTSTSTKYLIFTRDSTDESKRKIVSSMLPFRPLINYSENSTDMFVTARAPESTISVSFIKNGAGEWILFTNIKSENKDNFVQIMNCVMDQFIIQP